MDELAKLSVPIVGDDSNLHAVLKKVLAALQKTSQEADKVGKVFKPEATREVSRLGEAVQALRTHLTSLVGIDVGAFFSRTALGVAAIATALAAGLTKFKHIETATIDLESTLRSLGLEVTRNRDELVDFAEAMEKIPGIEKEMALGMIEMGLSSGIALGNIRQVVKTAIGLSAVSNQSAGSIVGLIAKLNVMGESEGAAKMLRRLNPEIIRLVQGGMKLTEAMQTVADRGLGKLAAREGTISGTIDKISKAFDNLRESIGTAIGPLVVPLLRSIAGSITLLAQAVGGLANNPLGQWLLKAATGFGVMAVGVKYILPWIISLAGAIKTQLIASLFQLEVLQARILAGGGWKSIGTLIATLGKGVAGLAIGIALTGNSMTSFGSETETAVDQTVEAFRNATTWVDKLWLAIGNVGLTIKTILTHPILSFQKIWSTALLYVMKGLQSFFDLIRDVPILGNLIPDLSGAIEEQKALVHQRLEAIQEAVRTDENKTKKDGGDKPLSFGGSATKSETRASFEDLGAYFQRLQTAAVSASKTTPASEDTAKEHLEATKNNNKVLNQIANKVGVQPTAPSHSGATLGNP